MSDDQKTPPKLPFKKREEAKFPPPNEPGPGPRPKLEVVPSNSGKKTITSGPTPKAYLVTFDQYKALTPAKQWQVLVKAFQVNRRSLFGIPGVTALDIGYQKTEDGKFRDELAIRVHVERKLPGTAFLDRLYDFIPKREPPPDGSKGYFQLRDYDVPLDVIEGNYVPFAEPPRPGIVLDKPKESEMVNNRRRLDPLVGGVSIGSPQAPAGTLGALVWDNTDGSVCILSNWHVLSGDPGGEAGIPCFQPGPLDQGTSNDVVAHLKRWSFDHQTDAAIAELTGSRHYCAGEILTLYQQISGATDPHLGMLVQKYGRSTGFKWGFIDGLYFTTTIEYSNGIVRVFEDQIHIAPATAGDQISGPGDSGSIWLTKTKSEGYKAVGLHFAGDLPHSAFGEYALANPMSVVMKNLDFSFRPGFLEIRDEQVLSPPPQRRRIKRGGSGVHPARIVADDTGSGDETDGVQPGFGG